MGAPPGYVGYEEGGQLTELVRRKPTPSYCSTRSRRPTPTCSTPCWRCWTTGLTDAQGHTVDFRNTVVIMTSNIGSPHLLEGLAADGELRDDVRDRAMGELRGHFRPEFLNRVDDIVLCKPLTLEEIEHIVDLQVDDVRRRLADRRMTLEITEPARGPDRPRGL